MHKLHVQKVKLMIYKNVKQCGVQQLAYLATEICNKYMQQIKWKVEFLPYKRYNYVNQDSVKDVFLNLSLMTRILGQLPFTKGNQLNLINLINIVDNRIGRTRKSKLSRKIQT